MALKKTAKAIGTTTLLTALLVPMMSVPTYASADQPASGDAVTVSSAISEVAPEVFDDKHTDLEITANEIVAVTSEIVSKKIGGEYKDTVITKKTTVPRDPNLPIVVGDESGNADVGIHLPFSNVTPEAEVLEDGTPVFDHQNGSSSTPVVKEDGSVQITTTVSDAKAPTRYVYESAVDGTDSIEQLENGTLIFLDTEGDYLAGIAPAWAKDARGVAVPTWYEVDGTNITQVVDHASQPDLTYPVVADPYFGKDLFSYTKKGSANGYPTYLARKSPYGQKLHLPGAGWGIFASFGWNELKAKQPGVTAKSTLKHQYDCHVTGGFFNIAGDWNLEQWRLNWAGWALDPKKLAKHRCNWTSL